MKVRKALFTHILTVVFVALSILPVLPASASAPIVNDTVYFAAVSSGAQGGVIIWNEDGTVFHNKGFVSVFKMYYKSPSMSTHVLIGHIDMETDFNFVVTGTDIQVGQPVYVGKGNAVSKWTLTFGEDVSGNPTTIFPYGKGTITGVAVAKYISTFDQTTLLPGNGNGLLVATHGTGDFANAKLMSTYAMYIMNNPSGRIERVTVGFDGSILPPGSFPANGNGDGVLTFH